MTFLSAPITSHRRRSPSGGTGRTGASSVSDKCCVLRRRSGHSCVSPRGRWSCPTCVPIFLFDKPSSSSAGRRSTGSRRTRTPLSSFPGSPEGRCLSGGFLGRVLVTILSRTSPSNLGILEEFLFIHPVTNGRVLSGQLSRNVLLKQGESTSRWKSLKESVRSTSHVRDGENGRPTGLLHEAQQSVPVFRDCLLPLFPSNIDDLSLSTERIRGAEHVRLNPRHRLVQSGTGSFNEFSELLLVETLLRVVNKSPGLSLGSQLGTLILHDKTEIP